jgi:fructokinase
MLLLSLCGALAAAVVTNGKSRCSEIKTTFAPVLGAIHKQYTDNMPIYAAVEGGGTTWRVALAEGHPSNIIESEVYETIDDAVEQLRIIREWLDKRKFDALGIATFGPIDPRPGSSTYGYITTTPKPGWANVDVVGALSNGKVPVQFDTDVNAPALAEYMVSMPKS